MKNLNLEPALINTDEQTHGYPVQIGAVEFLLREASDSNRQFLVFTSKLTGDGSIMERIMGNLVEVLVEGQLLAGWSGLQADGEDVEFSKAAALELLNENPKLAMRLFEEVSKLGAAAEEALAVEKKA